MRTYALFNHVGGMHENDYGRRVCGVTKAGSLKQARRCFHKGHYQAAFGVAEGYSNLKSERFDYLFAVRPIKLEKIKALRMNY